MAQKYESTAYPQTLTRVLRGDRNAAALVNNNISKKTLIFDKGFGWDRERGALAISFSSSRTKQPKKEKKQKFIKNKSIRKEVFKTIYHLSFAFVCVTQSRAASSSSLDCLSAVSKQLISPSFALRSRKGEAKYINLAHGFQEGSVRRTYY